MPEQFADLSHHNQAVDLGAYKTAGHSRVVLKATEGSAYADPQFEDRWKAAGQLGLRRGAYHFARTSYTGQGQAEHFLEAVDHAGGLRPGDVLILDLEDNTSPDTTAAAKEFLHEFVAFMGVHGHNDGLIYSGAWYLHPARITPEDVLPGWRHLWLSDYTPIPDATINLPGEWSRDQVVARQYTNKAAVFGIYGPCDYSRMLAPWPTSTNQHQEEQMVIVTAPGKPWLAYYPATGGVRVIGPDEPAPLRKIHQAAGDPATTVTLTQAEYDQVIEYADRAARGTS